MTKQYTYVGSQDIIDNLPQKSGRISVNTLNDILHWIKTTNQISEYNDNNYTATFIVDIDVKLWINDRHSEHVLCANGGNVLSAGEITFEISDNIVEVVSITNQSTGYCPEPKSWMSVADALSRTNIAFPENFTFEYIFRLCNNCGQKNIVKDSWYFCAVCDEALSKEWNFDN